MSIKDLGSYEKYVGKTSETISELGRVKSGIKSVPANTLLMSFKLSLGKTAITTKETYTNEAIMAFLDKGAYDVDIDYMWHQFQSKDWTAGTNTAVMGKTLSKKTLSATKIRVPSISEQKEIAKHLDAVQETLSLLSLELKTLDDLVKSEFVEMFGDPCDPTSTCFPKVALKDICELRIGPFGSALHKEDYVSDCHPIVNPSHITNGRIVIDNDLTVDEETFESMESYHLHTDDVVLGRRGEIGRCAVVEDEGLLCGTGCMILRPNGKECRSDYLQRIVSFPSFAAALEREAVGVTMKNLNAKIVGNALVNMPPIALQQQFADFVTKVDKLRFDCCRMTTYCDTVFSSVSARLLCT